jgi:hypothetical protein
VSLLRRLFGPRRTGEESLPTSHQPSRPAIADDRTFVCPSCGRTNLPPAGDWDPPICLECDAAINEDAIVEEAFFHDDW